ncbi:MAG: 4Fe-4S dicluster domain-containing protein [Thaumarchaeota archaeon]|nr:4Fe-4S dicluster domain-containing protein [Nitrososphaerota archaeon]
MPAPSRESYLFLPWYTPEVLYSTFFVSGLIMLYGLYRHLRGYGIGFRQFFSLLFKDPGDKVRRFLKFDLGQRKVLSEKGGGIMHSAIFYGFLMLLAYTTLIFIQTDILPLFTSAVFLEGSFYLGLEFLGDSLGIAYVVGLAVALYRRYVMKPEKLKTGIDDHIVLTMLIWIGISGFILESFRFLALPTVWATFSPVGGAISGVLTNVQGLSVEAPVVYQILWWAHMLSVFALVAITPYTKLVHVFTSGFNLALAERKPLGRLSTPFSLQKVVESGRFEDIKNLRSVDQLSPLRLLALDACTNCGRCQEVCPAYAAGRDLSPRVVVQDLGSTKRRDGDVFSHGVIREDELWACTTCNACVEVCPVLINQVDYIVDFRRTLVAENRLDGMKKTFLENIGRSNNPFGLPQHERQAWLEEMGVPTTKDNPDPEYVYWIGCQSSYDPRGRNVARAMVRILNEAKVNFAILGSGEACTGEPVRRLGEEARFQELALKNIETIRNSGAKKIVVNCAHCFNTFLNEYPEFGATFSVVHHSQLIQELISAGKIRPVESKETYTFHDPCNLGRVNGVIEPPREVLRSSTVDLREMKRSKMNSFCCGGGGANVWYQVPEKKKIGVIRVEEAMETGATGIAVACPFCITMFEDAKKTLGQESFAVKDIAEIVAEGL